MSNSVFSVSSYILALGLGYNAKYSSSRRLLVYIIQPLYLRIKFWGYSDLSNKSTGTFINSSRKFPAVRTFFPPNMTLAHLNRHVKELQCMGE